MRIDVRGIVGRYGLDALTVHPIVDRPGRLVARVTCRDRDVVVKVDADPLTFVAERDNIDRLRAAGLPVPTVVGFHDGEPSHLVMSWLAGEPLSSASPAAAQRRVGELLRRVHGIEAGPPYAGNATIDVWMAGWLNVILPWWSERGGRPDGVWDRYHRLRPLLAERGGQYMLFDGRPEHFIIDGDRVVGMIDVHDACPGDGAMDLAVLAVDDPGLLPGVLAGYGDAERPDELIAFYLIVRRLAAAEWALRHGDADQAARVLRLVTE